MRITSLSLLISFALAGGMAFAAPALAQDANADPDAPATTAVPTERLIDRHGEASAEAIAGLRAGSDFIIDGIAVSNSNSAMGYGEIDIALSLANALVESGTAADLASALDADVLALRAEGMGWGEIAQSLGFNLGEVMSAGRGAVGLAADVAAGAAADLEETGAGIDIGRNASAAGSANADANANANARVGLDRAAEARAGASVSANAGLDVRPVLPERPVNLERPAVPERPALPVRPELPVRAGRGGG